MKAIITLLMMLLCGGIAWGQSETTTTTTSVSTTKSRDYNIVLKPTIGINLTDFSKNPGAGKSKGQIGWQIGVSGVLGDKVYVEPGIFYIQKKSKFDSDTSASADIQFHVSGIRIPVAVGMRVIGDETKLLSVRVFAGGSTFIIMDAKEGNKRDFRSPSWAIFTGIGLNISTLFLDLSYEWSATRAQKDISVTNVGKPRTFFINAGIRVPI